ERIIDGIKVFGEGSAIEGIDEVLQQELGAEVSHFDQLNGVRVSGKAYLTSETALHYLANFGAVLNPIGLKLNQTKASKESSGKLINTLLFVALAIAFVVMATLSALKLLKYNKLKNEEAAIEAHIAQMEDIEGIAQQYEASVASYNIVKSFSDGTVSDNEMVLQFIKDLEKALPSDAHIRKFDSVDGVVAFEVTGTTKKEVGDVIIKLKALPYVSGVGLTAMKDELAPYKMYPPETMPILEFSDNEGHVVDPESFERSVIFPLVVALKNEAGTAVSDEVAAALAGTTTVDLSGATGDAAPVESAPETVEEVLP
ncbi:MAG: hypothetical protein II740_00315, partial [Lachnospiraceae bacterium]|nr:hypothetical protein [Lachnospiraceae bacterium]